MMEMDPILLGEILAGTLFFGIIFVLALGFPVAYTLAGTSLMAAAVGWYFEVFDFSNFGALASRYVGFMSSEVLVAVPLFIFMGVLLERSGIAEALLTTMGRLFGNVRGGLGFSVIIVGALLAASTGVVGATVVTMGLISLPAMLRAGYDPKLGAGVIAASGTLGQIIPPSTILIFMGDMLSGINAQVQMSKGNFAPTPVSVGDLFVGAILPSAVLVGLYMLYMAGKAIFDPKSCPATPFQREEGGHGLGREIVTALLPPLALILAVLGSILGGIAIKGRFSLRMLQQACLSTATITSMVFTLLLGAAVFSIVFRILGGEDLVHALLSNLPGGTMGALISVMLVMFLLGFVLDTFEVIFIIIPITAPVLLGMDVDPVWLGVLVGINLQTSFMPPPFGFSLIYLRGVAPASVTTGMIYRGAVPFVALQLIGLGIVMAFPELSTWLPAQVFRNGG